jgi:putative ABC transport system substrate-binding protein
MKRIFIAIILLSFQAFANIKIDIIQTIAHPALDSTRKGIIDQLQADNVQAEIKLSNAQGDLVISNQIANKFASEDPDVIISIATLASQSVASAAKETDIPIIFTSVTDPKGAGLIKENITGVSNFIPLDDQLAMFKQILPNMRKLGYLYNPGEVNSVKILKILEQIAPQYNLEIITNTANKTTDVSSAMYKLIGEVDAVFISNDNTALAAFGVISNIASDAKVPVFVSDTDMVTNGALASLGPNQYEIGKQTAKILLKYLNGSKINDIAIEYPEKVELVLNDKVAKKLGITFSESILNKARKS